MASEDRENVNRTMSSATVFSTNVPISSIRKKEKWVAQLLATKFHTETMIEPEEGVRLNPVMRDLIINEHVEEPYRRVVKKKRSKRQKAEIRAETMESVEDNQCA